MSGKPSTNTNTNNRPTTHSNYNNQSQLISHARAIQFIYIDDEGMFQISKEAQKIFE
jgi:hypothetical protein